MYTNDSKAENFALSWINYLKFSEIDLTLLSWITGITLLVFTAFIVVGNAFVVAVIALDPLKNIRCSPSNHLVLSLAVTDLLVGATICFLHGWWCIHYAVYKENLFNNSQQYTGVGRFQLVAISTVNLLALGIDRLIAIKVPLRSSYTVNKRRVRILIVIIWLYFCGLTIILGIFLPKETIRQDFIFNCHGLVAFVGLVINCGIVIHALCKQSSAMKHLCEGSNTLRNTVEREKKVTRGTIIITVVFIVSFVPFFISQLLEYFCVTCWINDPDVLVLYRIIALLLVLINSMVNPYIYAYRLPKYLEAFKQLGKRLPCCKSNVTPIENVNKARVEVLKDTATREKIASEETKL